MLTAANIGAAASSHTHSYAPLTGAGTSGSWGISVTGSSASCTGNAATATSAGKLTTTRALTIGAKAKNFDGSAAVSWTLAEIGAQKTITANTTEPTGGTAGDMYIKY